MRLFLGGRCYTAEKLKRIIWLKWLITVTTAGKHRTCLTSGCQRKALQDIRNAALIFATIAYDPDPDLTPLTVRRCARHCSAEPEASGWLLKFLGEGASAPQRGQQSGDGGKNGARYRHAAELHWSATLAEIER